MRDLAAEIRPGVSNHAVDKYRERVLACPERVRSDVTLRKAIEGCFDFFPMKCTKGKGVQIKVGPWRISKQGEVTVDFPTGRLVVEDGVIVTVLGFMMHTGNARMHRKRRHLKMQSSFAER